MGIFKRIWRVILPEDVNLRWRRLELAGWAFVLSTAFYPEVWGFLAWFALVRPIMILTRLDGRALFGAAYFFGFFFNLFTIYWVALVTPPGMVTAVAIVGLYYAIMLYMFAKLHHWKPWAGYLALPFLWTGLEHFRTLSEFAFPWSDLAYTQGYYLWILQIVSVIGAHGLTWLIVAVNVLLVQVFRKQLTYERRIVSGMVSVAVVVLLLGFGWIIMPRYPVEGKFGVALLQASVPLDVKWSKESVVENFELHRKLAESVDTTEVGLFVWPETAAPCYMTHDRNCQEMVGEIAAATGRPHFVGSLAYELIRGKFRHFNSSFHFDSSGQLLYRYDKARLVPFSEHVPYQDYLPFLEKQFLRKYLTFIDTYGVQWWSDFYPGDSSQVFSTGEVIYGPLICFEVAFPEYVREFVLKGAQFLVEITNDTWFERSVGVHMHSRIFVTRMIENRSWGARSANSGLTYIVDDYGRIRESIDLYAVAAVQGKVGLLDSYSIFTRVGDVAGRVSLLLTGLLLGIFIAVWFKRRISRRLQRASS